MARVTVEDCMRHVVNRFELVLLASRRARDIAAGSPVRVNRDNDKNSVIALREIAAGDLALDDIRNTLVRSFQKTPFIDEDIEVSDVMESLKDEQERMGIAAAVTDESFPQLYENVEESAD